jgi:glycosyltransferase involved in cell wall biosynthesis
MGYVKDQSHGQITMPFADETMVHNDSRGSGTDSQWFGSLVSTPLSLVLPMFNEAPVVDTTLKQAVAALERQFADFEIVVADDASTDGCADKVQQWTRNDPRIKLVRLPHNQRFGGALCAGLQAASKDFLVYTDFDLPIRLDSLPRLLTAFADADVLTGYSDADHKYANWKSKVISLGYNSMVRALFGLQLRDINFGFKAVRRSVWEKLQLRSRSPFVDAELFVQAEHLGFRVKEIPVPFVQRQLGASHIRRLDVIAATMLDMAKLRLTLARRLGQRAARPN